MASELLQLQWRFTRLLAQLMSFVHQQQGWELSLAEGRVTRARKVSVDGRVVIAEDRVHMANPPSLHYDGLAQDLNLYVNGVYIQDGKHPAWLEIGTYWKSLDDDCAWGGDFGGYHSGKDSNHFSLRYGGKE